MTVAGSLTYETKIDKNGFEKGLNSLKSSTNTVGGQIKSIVSALGIDKLISASFNLINNSIDGAISRLDTLNNYPKVMSNLGIATEDAQKSINKMSEKLSGLPTTLDEGALAVQRFTSKNSDVNKSTDYFLALNNALLAGGASADIQSTALEQLSQAYAKGKPDMMEWRSLQTAMPAQLNQVAKAFNMTSDELGEALRNGKISMDSFMDKIVELNENGTGEFQSFEEQARNSTGGIATSITVAKTQVVKGVADIISKIDELLKDNGLGGIGEIISNIGKKAKEMLDMVAEKLPNIISDIKEMKPYLEGIGLIIAGWKIGSTIQSVVQDFQEAKVALSLFSMQAGETTIAQALMNGTLSVGEGLVALLTGKMTLAELASAGLAKAQGVLNAVMSANPISLIIIAIVALIAIFVVLWNKCEWFRNFWIGLWEEIKSAFETAWEGIKTFFTETIPNWFNGLIEWFKNLPQKIYEVFWDFFQPIEDAFWDLYEKITAIIEETIENVKNTLKTGWNNIVNFFTQTIPQWIDNIIQWIKDLPYNIGYLIGSIIGHIVKFGQDIWNWITVDLPEIIQGIIDWFKQLPEKIYNAFWDFWQPIEDFFWDVYEIATAKIEETVENITNWFSELPGRIQEWLLNTIENIKNWGRNTYNTASEWISNTINSIINWFSQLPGRIWTWLLNTIEKVKTWGSNMANKGKTAALDLFNNIVDTIKSLPDKMLECGKNIVQGLWNGIVNAKNWIVGKVKEFAKGILDGMKNALGIHSPSTLFRDEIGKFIPQGVAVGVEADTDKAIKAIDDMNDDIISEMNKAVAFETGTISANASVKSNNSMLNVLKANIKLEPGDIYMDTTKVGRTITPEISKYLRYGGAY